MPLRAVIFDMDGVLIDSEIGYNRADAAWFAELGLPFGQREIDGVTGSSGPVIARLMKEWFPHLPYTEQQLSDLYLDGIFRSLRQDVHALIDGVEDWLRRMAGMDLSLAIGSSSPVRMVSHVVEKFALDRYFSQVVTGDDVQRGKPWPDIFLLAAQRLGLPPEECLVIEDSRNGIQAARAAGMKVFAFTGTNRHNLDLSGADASFSAFTPHQFALVEAL